MFLATPYLIRWSKTLIRARRGLAAWPLSWANGRSNSTTESSYLDRSCRPKIRIVIPPIEPLLIILRCGRNIPLLEGNDCTTLTLPNYSPSHIKYQTPIGIPYPIQGKLFSTSHFIPRCLLSSQWRPAHHGAWSARRELVIGVSALWLRISSLGASHSVKFSVHTRWTLVGSWTFCDRGEGVQSLEIRSRRLRHSLLRGRHAASSFLCIVRWAYDHPSDSLEANVEGS